MTISTISNDYFDYVFPFSEHEYQLHVSNTKPNGKNSTLKSFQCIEQIFRKNLPWYDLHSKAFSPLEEHSDQIIANVHKIFSGYQNKIGCLSFFQRQCLKLSITHYKTVQLHRRICSYDNFINKVPDEIIQYILSFFQLRDLCVVSQVNTRFYANASSQKLIHAQMYGYQGNTIAESNRYFQHITQLKFFFKSRDIPDNYFAYIPSTHKVDWIKTMIQFKDAGTKKFPLSFYLNQALLKYANHPNTDIIETLIFLGADINTCDKNGRTPLILSAMKGNAKNVKIILDCNANPNYSCYSLTPPLIYAINSPNPEEICKLILDNEVNSSINQVSSSGFTPLHEAVKKNLPQLVKRFISSGANIEAYDSQGFTPLILSIMQNNPEITQQLIQLEADPGKPCENGKYPITFAVEYAKSYEITKIILNSKGAKTINYPINSGETPLHLAAKKGLVSIIQLLLEYGADQTIKNSSGKTPLEVAKNQQCENLFKR